MPDAPDTKVAQLRALVDRGAYTVDTDQVAEAIVARLIAGRTAKS